MLKIYKEQSNKNRSWRLMNVVWGQDVREEEEGHISERCKQVVRSSRRNRIFGNRSRD